MAEFPTTRFHADGRIIVVADQEALDALGADWHGSPADFGLITAPDAEQLLTGTAAAAAADYAPHGRIMRAAPPVPTPEPEPEPEQESVAELGSHATTPRSRR